VWRGRLPSVLARLRETPGTIAYFGASTTAQKRGYRPNLHAALMSVLGGEQRAVNAGIGGIGSLAALFLIDEFVLAAQPQLCFVEFTTSDEVGLTPLHLLADGLAAIVAKLRAHGCEPCFLHLFRTDRRSERVLEIYERVASELHVSTIDLSAAAGTPLAEGASLLRDTVHTSELGGEAVAEAVARAVASVSTSVADRAAATSTAKGRFVGARLIAAHSRVAPLMPVIATSFRAARSWAGMQSGRS
jgi:lysophospholipase L1-like esterase